MTDSTPSPLGNVITIDDERIKNHLDRVVRGTVEETLNALLDAEANRLCLAVGGDRGERRGRSQQRSARRIALHQSDETTVKRGVVKCECLDDPAWSKILACATGTGRSFV
jgi:hypothetical protein